MPDFNPAQDIQAVTQSAKNVSDILIAKSAKKQAKKIAIATLKLQRRAIAASNKSVAGGVRHIQLMRGQGQ